MNSRLYDRLPLIAFVFIVLLAGLNPIAVHYTVLELPPFWGGAIRFFPASIIMFTLAYFLKLPLPKGRGLTGALIYGGVQFGAGFALLNSGLQKVQPGMVSVILALSPLFTLIFAILHRLEHFRWLALLGSFISVAGIGLVFREQLSSQVPFTALLSVVLGTMCLSESAVIIKKFPKSHPITINAIAMGTGSLFLTLIAIVTGEKLAFPLKQVTWIAIGYSIILGSCVLFMLFVYVLNRWAASAVAYQLVVLPFVTLSASNLITQEKLSPILLVGAALVLIGVYLGGIYSPGKHAKRKLAQVSSAIVDAPKINPNNDCLQTGDC